MSKIEFDSVMALYEFETRALFFMEEVEEAAQGYPNVKVFAFNSTVEMVDSNSDDLERVVNRNRPEVMKALYQQGHEYEVNSAKENVISVVVNCRTRIPIHGFFKKVNIIAKKYIGVNDDPVVDTNDLTHDTEDLYRFYAVQFFLFKEGK